MKVNRFTPLSTDCGLASSAFPPPLARRLPPGIARRLQGAQRNMCPLRQSHAGSSGLQTKETVDPWQGIRGFVQALLQKPRAVYERMALESRKRPMSSVISFFYLFVAFFLGGGGREIHRILLILEDNESSFRKKKTIRSLSVHKPS